MEFVINEAFNNGWDYDTFDTCDNFKVVQVWKDAHCMTEYVFGLDGMLIETNIYCDYN